MAPSEFYVRLQHGNFQHIQDHDRDDLSMSRHHGRLRPGYPLRRA
jgi:hypothetical protein